MNETRYSVTWRQASMVPYILDVDGEDALALATAIAMNLAEMGRSEVMIVEHQVSVSEDLLAMAKERAQKVARGWGFDQALREIVGGA